MNVIRLRARLSSALVLSALVFALFPLATLGQTWEQPCAATFLVDAGDRWSSHSSDPLDGQILAVTVQEPGWLALQASATTSGASNAAWLGLQTQPCDPDSLTLSGPAEALGQSLVYVRKPGRLYLTVGAVDPSAGGEPPSLNLSTRLFPARHAQRWNQAPGPRLGADLEDGGGLLPGEPNEAQGAAADQSPANSLQGVADGDGAPGDDTEEEDAEILPFTFPGGPYPTLGFVRPSAPLEVIPGQDGAPGDDTEEEDAEILPFVSPTPGSAGIPCGAAEPADDFPFCATELSLGLAVEGSLESSSGFDQDHYTFQVNGLRRIRIAIETQADIRATLIGPAGLELLTRTTGPATTEISIEVILIPGRYTLRLEGQATGDSRYRLVLDNALPGL